MGGNGHSSACHRRGPVVFGPALDTNEPKHLVISWLLAVLGMLLTWQASAQQVNANVTSAEIATPLSSPKDPPSTFYTPFFDEGDHLKELVDEGQFEVASALYSKFKDEFFASRREKYSGLIAALAVGLDKTYQQAFLNVGKAISKSAAENESSWPAAKESISNAIKMRDAFTSIPAVKDASTQLLNLAELSGAIEIAQAYWRTQATSALSRFDMKRDFFTAYPIEIGSPKEVIEDAVPRMLEALRAGGQEGVLSLAKTYERHLGSSRALALLSNLYVEMAIQSAGSTERLGLATKALLRAREAGLSPTQVPGFRIAFAEATSQTLLKEGQIEFPVAVELNLPFEVKKTSLDEALSADGSQFDFVIVLDVSLARTLQRVQKRDEVPSQFLSGSRESPNPSYEQARMAVFQAQMNLSNHQSQYCYGYGCIAKAILSGVLSSKVQEQQKIFAATPMTITEPVYNDYKFSASDVAARKAVTANYYIIDLASRTYFKAQFDVAEEKNFRIAYRLHEKDKNRETHLRSYNTEAEIKKFNDAPSTVRLSDVLDQYLRNPGQSQPLKSPIAMRDELLADKNTTLAGYKEKSRLQSTTTQNDTRFASVVVVHNPKGMTGTGFFVESDLVLTNYHVVEGSQFVEMKLFNGLETFGKVVKSDVRLDLALVKVQARGAPVTFFDGPIPLGSTVEAIGHPAGLNFSITRGVVSAVRKRPALSGVGGKEVTFVQTDTPINPGNSGGAAVLGRQGSWSQ